MCDVLTEILQAANKHPNSRVSKLIYTVREDPTQKNIVLLLIELAEHAEFSTDFNISLKYYLNLFDSLGITSDLVLNEAGLLLLNSSKIYSKRVDYVQSLVERQILTLSNADHELQQQKLNEKESTESETPVEKPKKGRKRALEVPSDPYEVELAPKKFKKLSEEKRFSVQKTTVKAKSIQRNIEMEQHIHPAGWMYAAIYDFDNEEDVDTKRNYKLFTYHVEHRYNTLVPDINFRLHFKVKDYIDAQEEEMDEDEACNTDRTWPPLSEAYIQKYLKLENYVLEQDIHFTKRKAMPMEDDERENMEEDVSENPNDISQEKQLNDIMNNIEITAQHLNTSIMNESRNDSGLGQSLLDNSNITNTTIDTTQLDKTNNTNLDSSTINSILNDTNPIESDKSLNLTQSFQDNDSALGTSLLNQTNNTELNSSGESSGNLDTTNCNETVNQTTVESSDSSASLLNLLNNTELNSSTETSGNLDTNNCNEIIDQTTAVSESLQQNDSALGTCLLDPTNNTELTLSGEASGNLVTINCNTTVNQTTAESSDSSASLLNLPNNSELNSSTETTGNLDTNNCNETLNQAIAETSENLDATNSNETLLVNTKNITESNKISVSERENTSLSMESQENEETSRLKEKNLEHTTELKELTDNIDTNEIDAIQLLKPTDNTRLLDLDVVEKNDGDRSQILLQLPNMDDEGVYLSDLEDQNRILLPTIKITNILPGVQRKDITIIMDDELRQALELRDGITEHFGREKYYVPVTTEPKKQMLHFNILKLPEKIIRKTLLFKLGPEMDLYIQARSLKRKRLDPQPREYSTTNFMQWFALNNTDMSGITMTPPNSPGHCSNFYGFTDDESSDAISCSEFYGFSDDDTSQLKYFNRLSRDSGVGVDVNQLTPEKETLEVIFENQEELISKLGVDSHKNKLNLRDNNESNNESTESILNQLPTDIRDALAAEINDVAKENTETPIGNQTNINDSLDMAVKLSTELASSINTSEATETSSTELASSTNTSEVTETSSTELASSTNTSEVTETSSPKLASSTNAKEVTESSSTELENSAKNKEVTEMLSTENSNEFQQLNSTSATEEIEKLSSTNSNQNSIDNVEQSSETLSSSLGAEQSDVAQESQDLTKKLETNAEVSEQTNSDVVISSGQPTDLNKTAENETENTNCDKNNRNQNVTFGDHHADDDVEDSEDEAIFDLDTHGNKTKIQLWHEHLQPILAKSRERHHFDVFQLGTEIIDTVKSKTQRNEKTLSNSSTSSPPVALFHDIMDDKDKSYVSRYFLSTLLLANQSNIEISLNNKSSEKPSSWNDIQLKLLSTKRHTVAIEDNIGMTNNNKNTAQKGSEKTLKTKTKVSEQSEMEIDDDEEDGKPLVKLKVTSKTMKEVKTSYKRASENRISAIAEKKPKGTSTTILKPNESATISLITNVQIISPPKTITTATTDHTSTLFSSTISLPQFNDSTEVPSTSQQAQDLQALEVNLNSIRTLQPIQKVPSNSDDYDSGIFSIDEPS